MSVLLTAVVVLTGLIGCCAVLVGLVELSSRAYQRKWSRDLVVSLEDMLVLSDLQRGH
jgi:ABC-type transporter Mla maintaining outer membrane lipid asymmetry permease subunit MlaE